MPINPLYWPHVSQTEARSNVLVFSGKTREISVSRDQVTGLLEGLPGSSAVNRALDNEVLG